MFVFSVFFFALGIVPSLPAVVKTQIDACSVNEFACSDGACVSLDRVCDGAGDCADFSDERACSFLTPDANRAFSPFRNDIFGSTILHRDRRQAKKCRRNQWQCKDGTCIGFDGKCDGAVDCPDGSDETYALCRNSQCQSNWFRCSYGACVDGTAPCNKVQECADNSDELIPQCRNETFQIRGQFQCADGTTVSASVLCDGAKDCVDGSDETIRVCGANQCPSYLFRCAYGACVDQGADCDGNVQCADGSDESDELCNRIGTSGGPTTSTIRPSSNGACVLPPFPEHGTYSVAGVPKPTPGQTFDTVFLNVSCMSGYAVVGDTSLHCYSGFWSRPMPQCVRFCKLLNHPSVEYRCSVPGVQGGYRECNELEPAGTLVLPECRSPNYYSARTLPTMHCIDGFWDYQASQLCQPECGKVTSEGTGLIIDGEQAKRGELPWHVGVYRKTVTPYMQICGGTIVSTTLVISAAHCFWKDGKQLPSSNYAVAAGKIYRPWNDKVDKDAQKRDVSDIKIPIRFDGEQGNFGDDIALVILAQVLEYKTYVRPACLDFKVIFNREQLKDGNLGKVAGWGLTEENGAASPTLKVTKLPYVNVIDCRNIVPPNFRAYITHDKFCAGFANGTSLCQGDSGGGLVFPSVEREAVRYYLRGIVSAAPKNQNKCTTNSITTFTQIISHEEFIKPYYTVG